MNKVAFITAIYGGYEKSCKPFAKQSIPTDFICFTDTEDIQSNGWIIDTTPYHFTSKSKVDNGYYINSLHKVSELSDYIHSHTFHIAKYYKQAWHNIERLKQYDVVIWLDGTLEITDSNISEYVIDICSKYKVASWHHEMRGGNLIWEVQASRLARYLNEDYLGQKQPFQDVVRQYHEYLEQGYKEDFWKNIPDQGGRGPSKGRWDSTHFGMWVTCFVAFKNNDVQVIDFLDKWYTQTLKYTTQDQVGFPKVVQDTKLIPYTFPDEKYIGDAHCLQGKTCSMFIKHEHGK